MSDAGSQAAASNDVAHPRTASGTSCSRRRSKIAHAACFGKSPWDDPLGVELMRRFPPPNFTVRPLQRLLSRRTIFTAAAECGQDDPASISRLYTRLPHAPLRREP